jgi:hypothetical protein
LVIVADPFDAQVAAAVLMVGVAGTFNCNPMLNEALAVELHEPFEDVTV